MYIYIYICINIYIYVYVYIYIYVCATPTPALSWAAPAEGQRSVAQGSAVSSSPRSLEITVLRTPNSSETPPKWWSLEALLRSSRIEPQA